MLMFSHTVLPRLPSLTCIALRLTRHDAAAAAAAIHQTHTIQTLSRNVR